MTGKGYHHVYIASCDEQGGIYHYHMEDSSGQLTEVSFTPMDSPKYMVIADGKMYIVLKRPYTELEDSGLVVYDLDEDGNPANPSEICSTMGLEACHLAVVRDTVYCANYTSGSIIKMPDQLVQHTGSGPDLNRQEGPHAHYVGLAPDGAYLLAVDLGADAVFGYDLSLNPVAKSKMPAGHGPRHLIFSDDGKTCFVANELISSVTVCSYESGRLTVLDTVSTLPENFSDVSYCSAIRYRNGKVYVSNRGHNSIAVMDFDGSKLTLSKTFDCGGNFPRDFDLCGKYLICTNQLSDDVTVFEQDDMGSFRFKDKIAMKTPLCVAFM